MDTPCDTWVMRRRSRGSCCLCPRTNVVLREAAALMSEVAEKRMQALAVVHSYTVASCPEEWYARRLHSTNDNEMSS